MIRQLMFPKWALLIALAAIASQGLAEDQQAKEILRRAIDAAGGQRRLDTLKAPTMWMEKGTFHGGDEATPFIAHYASKWPNWYRQNIENAFSIGIDGDLALVSSSAGTRVLTGDQLKEQLIQARIARALFLFPLNGEEYSLSSEPGIEVDGRLTIGIKASHRDGRDANFYFDKKTYLIAKIETVIVTPQTGPDPVTSETLYWAHRSFGGATMPSKYKRIYAGNLFVEGETVDIKVRATLDPKWFSIAEKNDQGSE